MGMNSMNGVIDVMMKSGRIVKMFKTCHTNNNKKRSTLSNHTRITRIGYSEMQIQLPNRIKCQHCCKHIVILKEYDIDAKVGQCPNCQRKISFNIEDIKLFKLFGKFHIAFGVKRNFGMGQRRFEKCIWNIYKEVIK
jgi:hypothetical protein